METGTYCQKYGLKPLKERTAKTILFMVSELSDIDKDIPSITANVRLIILFH